MNYSGIRALIRNDLRIYLTDRRALLIGVLVPIIIAAFFGYVFGGNGSAEPAGRMPIAVADEDRSAARCRSPPSCRRISVPMRHGRSSPGS